MYYILLNTIRNNILKISLYINLLVLKNIKTIGKVLDFVKMYVKKSKNYYFLY